MSDPDLPSYLERSLPPGCSYEDAVNLHWRLFCTLDGVPSELRSQCSRPGLSHAFALLVRGGRIRSLPPGIAATMPGHWSRVLDGILSGKIEARLDLEWFPRGAR